MGVAVDGDGGKKSAKPSRMWEKGGLGMGHCRANMAHTRQARPESGLGFQVKVLDMF